MRISPSASHSRMSVHQNHILINICFRWEWPSDQRPPYWTTPVGQTLSVAPLVEPLFLWLLLISNQGKRWTLQYSLNIEVLAIVWDDQVTDIYTESFHDQCREERRNKCLKYRSTLWFGFIWSDAEAECSSRGAGQRYHIFNYFCINWKIACWSCPEIGIWSAALHTYIYDCFFFFDITVLSASAWHVSKIGSSWKSCQRASLRLQAYAPTRKHKWVTKAMVLMNFYDGYCQRWAAEVEKQQSEAEVLHCFILQDCNFVIIDI